MNNLALTDLKTSTVPVLPWEEIERLIARKMLDFQSTLNEANVPSDFTVTLQYTGRCQARMSDGIKFAVSVTCGDWGSKGEVDGFNNVERAMEETLNRWRTNDTNQPKQITHQSIGE